MVVPGDGCCYSSAPPIQLAGADLATLAGQQYCRFVRRGRPVGGDRSPNGGPAANSAATSANIAMRLD